jgi:parallel beta-helix repeat protein
MKRIIVGILLICIGISFLLTASEMAISEESQETILYVDDDGGKQYLTISEALNNASDGDTIYVYNGTYYGNLSISKSISLIGENKENTIISGTFFSVYGSPNYQHSSNLINVISDNVKISGFTIKNSTWLEALPSINENNISSPSMMINVGVGIRISSDNITISGNNITQNGESGITVYNGQNIIISSNQISGNSQGIYLQRCSNNTIMNNTIKNNTWGVVFLSEASENVFYHNNFINNTLYHTSDNGKNIFYSEELKQGNYWDDYNGTDKDNDAIGDTPYTILGGLNQDPYPLIMPYLGRLVLKEYYVDQDLVIYMLWIAMIVAIIFSIPIAYFWYRKIR